MLLVTVLLVVVVLFTCTLLAINEGDDVPRWEPLRRALVLLLQSIPVALVLFVVLQGWEYHHAYTELGLKLSTGIYGATFFMLTGFHGFHVIVGTIFLTQTRGGGRFMAAGGNAEALRRSGVNANLYKVLGFVLSAALAGVAGIVTAAYTTQGNPAAATESLFTGLTAVALSGISLAGGRGSLPKVMVGALVIAEITSILNIKNIQPFWGIVITGALLIGSLYLEMTIQKQVSKRVVESKNQERQESAKAADAAAAAAKNQEA